MPPADGSSGYRLDNEPVEYPLLIVCGEHDLDLAKEIALKLEKIEPNGQYSLIENAGHCANIDNPTVFNDRLKQFITERKA